MQEVTDIHVIISEDKLGRKKEKSIPIHIARPYFKRDTNSPQKVKRIHPDYERHTVLHKKQNTVSDKTSNST